MNKFKETLEKMYEDKKDLENPPEYLKIIEELLELE